MKQLSLILFSTLVSIASFGQVNAIDQRLVEEAKGALSAGDNLSAFNMLYPYYSNAEIDWEYRFTLAQASWRLSEYKSLTIDILNPISGQDDYHFIEFYSEVLLQNGFPERAIQQLNRVGEDLSDRGQLLYEQCKNALTAINQEVSIVVSRLGEEINSSYAEHSPLVTTNHSELYFTSRRPLVESSVKDYAGQYDENIYYSQRDHGLWSKSVPLPGNVNQLLNEATSALSVDGDQMLVFKTSQSLDQADIWIAENESGIWQWDTKLNGGVNSKDIEQSATWNTDRNLIYFSSNREGGFGGFDLYRVIRFANGDYSEAVNLGPEINSEFDEISPYLSPDDETLYFANNGSNSIGGFDLFSSKRKLDNTWDSPINLGYPLNSTRDEFQITLTWLAGIGYFTRSKQDNIGDLDIYKTTLPGFNVSANVHRFIVDEFSPELDYEITLWDSNFEETLGYFFPTKKGEFIVVLMPEESGILEVVVPGYEVLEVDLSYSDSQGIKEFTNTVQLKPNDG